ncbi:hypothetical protein GOP47_0000494 [Adiantum capillus-veneris]|uniref:Uncharacterized protein n=1 Tax=Adiantum capillus-veneris TaxID=13818 RepID=A0A9D4ZT51_ADICA|nr:hypothetical protein GOP47_0000494 [Adiantum capillus-veneris]
MSNYNHHHHQHQHQHQPEYVEQEYYGEERVYAPPPPPQGAGYERVNSGYYERRGEGEGYRVHNNNYQRNERLGELGAVAAGAFALYEEGKTKTDPMHATKHKHEAEGAALGALGSGGYAYYEHRQKEAYNDRRY